MPAQATNPNEHSPGPWTNGRAAANIILIFDAGGEGVSSVVAIVGTSPNAQADAALITEAPTLAGLLNEIVDDTTTDFTPGWYARARTCCARIHGEAP